MKKIIFSIAFILVILSSMFSINAFAAEMADGTYEVNIALWHSEDDKESMAADAIGKKATIVVENGVKTMHITSGEMSMMGIKASLQELRIADAKGNFTDAKVESRNSEGNPTGFYFTMPHTNEYITVKVNPHLAIMGNKDIGARIKVDYSTLKLIKSAETTTEFESDITAAQETDGNEETVSHTEAQTTTGAADNSEQITDDRIVFSENENTSAYVQPDSNEKNNLPLIIGVSAAAAIIVLVIIVVNRKK